MPAACGSTSCRTTPTPSSPAIVDVKPSVLTNPLAVPSDAAGANVRAKSIPTSDTGPPAPTRTTKTTSCHIGRGDDGTSSHTQATRVTAQLASTDHDRRSGCRAVNRPTTGPVTIAVTVRAVSSTLASAAVRFWAVTKNGTPHSSATTFALNGVAKWLQKPSRVPGGRRAARNAGASFSCACASRGRGLRMPANATPAAAAPTAASVPNAAVQPWWCSNHATGIADARLPDCPMSPVTCTITGARCGGNHSAMSRIALMKMPASPAPSRTRASSARGTVSASASRSCPTAITSDPTVMTARGPKRSRSRPAGICMTV